MKFLYGKPVIRISNPNPSITDEQKKKIVKEAQAQLDFCGMNCIAVWANWNEVKCEDFLSSEQVINLACER